MTNTEALHFTIGEGLDDLARQGYWFEDRKEWGINLIKHLCMGITEKQINDVLNGDANVVPTKNGTMVNLVYEENVEFKKKLTQYLITKKKNAEYRVKAEKHLDKCGQAYSSCKYQTGGKCCFSKRKEWGCFMDNPEKIDSQINFNMTVRKQEFIDSFCGNNRPSKLTQEISGIKCKPLEKHSFDLSNELDKKVYDFIFKEHHYTINDSARNQSKCPHCDYDSRGSMWDRKEDKKDFIGINKISDNQFLYCFECPNCFGKFFYHSTRKW